MLSRIAANDFPGKPPGIIESLDGEMLGRFLKYSIRVVFEELLPGEQKQHDPKANSQSGGNSLQPR